MTGTVVIADKLDSSRCHVTRAKGEKDRVIFVKPSVLSELVDLADKINDHTGLLFKTLKGQSVETAYLRKMIKRKAIAAGIQKRVHFHLLRHTYLTRLYGRTKDLRLVQEVAGHADISTTQIYTHISGEDVRQAMLVRNHCPKRLHTIVSVLKRTLRIRREVG